MESLESGMKNKDGLGFIDEFMEKFLIFSGIWKSTTQHQYNRKIAYFNLTVLFAGFVSISYMFILKYDDMDVNIEILIYFVEIFYSICAQLLFIVNCSSISRLAQDVNTPIQQIQLPVHDRERYIKILRHEQLSFWKTIKVTWFGIMVLYIIVILETVASVFSGEMKLFYLSWFPFKTDGAHIWFYLLANVFQIMIYVEILYIDIAIIGLWYAAINKASGLLTILSLSLQKLSKSGEGHLVVKRYNKDIQMKMCIALHNYVINLVKDLNSSVGFIFVVVVLSSQATICFSGFNLIQGVSTQDTSQLIKYLGGVAVFTLILFIYCSSGQKLKNKSEDLFRVMYDSDWYRMSLQQQQAVYLCQTISKKPLVVVGGLYLPADLHTFQASLRTVFSYLNFLLALKDKN